MGVPGGVFLLATLGGIAGWRAHAIMFAGPDDAVAATSLPMKEYAVALVPPLTYTGQLRIDDMSVTWWISWSARLTTPHMKRMAHIGSVPLAEIIDARIVPIPEPMRVPSIDHIFDGRPLYPQQGELFLVRTAHGETGIPAESPRRMYQLLNIRCGMIHSTRVGQPGGGKRRYVPAVSYRSAERARVPPQTLMLSPIRRIILETMADTTNQKIAAIPKLTSISSLCSSGANKSSKPIDSEPDQLSANVTMPLSGFASPITKITWNTRITAKITPSHRTMPESNPTIWSLALLQSTFDSARRFRRGSGPVAGCCDDDCCGSA